MSAERSAASSRVRFDATLNRPFWRNSPEMPAVETAHDPSRANHAGTEARRLLVRPYLPVGLDRLPLDRRGAEGPPGHGYLARHEPVGAERGQGRPA